jgi:glycosyltransferase involved in cell wall biosynthesis
MARAHSGRRRSLLAPLLGLADVVGAGAVLLVLAAWTAVRAIFARRPAPDPATRKLLVLDMSYRLQDVLSRQLQEPIMARDLEGFFAHVWSVHPCATVIAPEQPGDTFGRFTIVRLADRHTIIEGKIGRVDRLRRLPMTNFLLAQFELLRYLRRLILHEHISAIRAGDPYYLGLFAMPLSLMTGIPRVFRIALNYDAFYASMGHLAYPRLFRWRWLERIVSRAVLKRADLVAGGNQDCLDFALNNGARKEYCTIFRIGNLIHKAHFQPPDRRPDASSTLSELGLSGRPFSITVCRLEPLKHIDDVLRAVSDVRSQGIDLHALIVGDGRLRDELDRLAQSLGIADVVVFAGNRSQEWIATVLPHAMVVLSPHMGRGLTEALLSGTPVVAYDVEWQSEVVRSGQTGELVDYRDWSAMARAARTICADRGYAQRLGTMGRTFTLDLMDPARLSQHERSEYLKLFERLDPTKPRNTDSGTLRATS